MKQKKIKTIIKDHVKELTKYCEDINNGFDKEAIHNFRVTVKTLRSFLRLLRIHPYNPKLKMQKRFKQLYHIIGAIRETQLEIEKLTDKQQELPHYIDQLHHTLDRQKKEWEKRYSKKILRKLKSRLTGVIYTAVLPDILERFFNNRMGLIDVISHEDAPSDNEVHTVRKKAKDILYVSGLTKKKWKKVYKQKKYPPIKKLNTLAAQIGDYNDERVLIERLNAFSSQAAAADEKDAVTTFCLKEATKLTTDKKRIINKAKRIAR